VWGTNIVSDGYNLIGSADATNCWIGSDFTGTDANPVSAGLDTTSGLGFWGGGKTKTLKLLSTSLAYDTGDTLLHSTNNPGQWLDKDQSGATRNRVVSGQNKVHRGASDYVAP